MTTISSLNALNVALTAVKTVSEDDIDSLTNLGAAFKIFGKEKSVEFAVNNRLNQSLLELALKYGEVDDELKKAIIDHYEAATATRDHSGAMKGATVVTNTFSGTLKGLWATIIAFPAKHPLLMALMAIGAVAGATALAVDHFVVSLEEQKEIFAEAKSTYSQTTSELSSLESQLTSIRNRLKELNELAELGTITPDESAELEALKTENNELERQLKVKQKLAEVEKKEVEQAALATYEKTTYESITGDYDLSNGRPKAAKLQGTEYVSGLLDALKKVQESQNTVEQQFQSGAITAGQYKAQMSVLNDTYQKYDQAINDVIPDLQEIANNIYSASGDAYDQKVAILAVIDAWLDFGDSAESALNSAGDLLPDFSEQVDTLADRIKKLDTTSEAIESLGEALGELVEDGRISIDTISSLQETFGNTAGFDEFIRVVGDSDSSFTDIQNAVNALAKTYLDSSDIMNGLTDDTLELTIAELEHLGVTNAEEIATERLRFQKLEAAIAAEGLTRASVAQTTAFLKEAGATQQDIEMLYKLRTAKVQTALSTTDFVTASVQTVNALLYEAKAAGIATKNYEALERLRSLKKRAEEGKLDEHEANNYGDYIKLYTKQAQEGLDEIAAGITIPELKLTVPAITSDSGKSAAEKAAEKAKETFEEVYNEMKHKLDMGKITDEEFINWLDGSDGYKKYLSNNKLLLDDYRKYEKEVYDGRKQIYEADIQAQRDAFQKVYDEKQHLLATEQITFEELITWLNGQDGWRKYFTDQEVYAEEFQKNIEEVFEGLRTVHEDYLSDIDHEISVLKRQGDAEDEIIAKYNEKTNSILATMEAHKNYLRSTGATEEEILSNDYIQELETELFSIEDDLRDFKLQGLRDAFDEVLKEWQHDLDMGLITHKEFIDRLNGPDGYKKYFANNKDLIDEYRSYEKTVFDGMWDDHEDYLSDIDHAISLLEDQEGAEAAIIEKYREKKTSIEELIVLWGDYLRSAGWSEAEIAGDDRMQDLLSQLSSVANSIKETEKQSITDEFQKIYDAKKHALEMEQITLEEFTSWLNGSEGFRKYYADQEQFSEEFLQHEKEVFDNLRQIHEDYLADIDHEISLLERQEGAEDAVVAKYREKQAELRALIIEHERYLRSIGTTEDEIRNNDYMQDLVSQIYEAEDAIRDIDQTIHDQITKHVNDLIDLTEELIRKEKEEEIEALEEQKDAYSEIIAFKKELIQINKRETEYSKSVAEKTKRLAEIEAKLAQLKLDDSKEAALERGALAEEQAELQKELDELQSEHHIDSVEASLDKEEKEFHDLQDSKIDAIEDFLDDNEAVNKAALERLDTMNKDLYDDLLGYAKKYTETTEADLLTMWSKATAAAEKYNGIVNASKVYEDSESNNQIQSILQEMRDNGHKWAAATTDAEREKYDKANLKLGAQLEELLGVSVDRDDNGVWWIGDQKLFEYGQASSTNNLKEYQIRDLVAQMRENGKKWTNATTDDERKSAADANLDIGRQLQDLMGVPVWRDDNGVWWFGDKNPRELLKVYHEGTPAVGGFPTPKQNETFALLKNDEAVYTKQQQENLHKWINWDMIDSIKRANFPLADIPKAQPLKNNVTVSVSAPITMYGDMDRTTMNILERHAVKVADIVGEIYRR